MKALASIGSGPSDVTRLLLTHCHPDHAGGAAYVAEQTGREVERARRRRRLTSALGTQPDPDPDAVHCLVLLMSTAARWRCAAGARRRGDAVRRAGARRGRRARGRPHARALAGSLLATCTAESGLLITGDAIFNVLGLRWPIKALCSNFAMTQQTAHRLAELDYTTAAFTHGPEITDRPREAIRRFLAKAG